jgi:nucleoside-diphosphate-sugar epimerase
VLGIDRSDLRFGAVANMREEMEHEPVNTDRLAGITGWHPGTTIAEGVRRTRAFALRSERSL